MKTQVVVIHGGDTFETYEEYINFLKDFEIDSLDYFRGTSWKNSLPERLGESYEVIALKMPNKSNAKYKEWKIWFEKLIPLLNDEVALVGHSLGGIFLAKYLSENDFPKNIKGTFLVAAPFDEVDADYALADFELPGDLSRLGKQGGKTYFYHSKDDYVVPFADLNKYQNKIPYANYMVFKDRAHFHQEEFPELVENIKGLN